jgi:hypothetical protein
MKIPKQYSIECRIDYIDASYDVSTGRYASSVINTENIDAVVDRYEYTLVDGDKIRHSDWRLLYIPSGPLPALKDKIVLPNDLELKIISVRPSYMGSTVKVIELQLRE